MSDSATEFMALASRASDAFVRDGISLNEAIAKIASDKDLNQVQIQRVVALANHETHDRLRKTAEDKTFRFDVASVDGVLGHLHPQDGHQKVAGLKVRLSMRDYVGLEQPTEAFQKLAEANHEHPTRRAIRVRTACNQLDKIAKWFRTHRSTVLSKQAGLHQEIRDEIGSLTRYALNHVAAGQQFSDLHKLACNYDRENGRLWDVVFNNVRDSLIKTAASPMVAALKRDKMSPSDEVPVEVINGNHRLLIGLDTLRNKISDEDKCAKRLRLMDTLGPAVVESIRKLENSTDVQKYISDEIEKTAELASGDVDAFLEAVEKVAGVVGAIGGAIARNKGRVLKGAAGGLAGLAAFKAAKGAGEGITEGTRNWRPGAYRPIDQGGVRVD